MSENSSESPKPRLELGEFIIANNHQLNLAGGTDDEINRILTAIKLAAKVVNHHMKNAGLNNIVGSVDSINIQGEEQQKLDIVANRVFLEVVCGICSEEDTNFISVNPDASYVALLDPLDGSSNIDTNSAVGTIFSVYKRISPVSTPVQLCDFLQCGEKQILTGYIIYGSSTMLVLSFGKGVHGFTLDTSLGTFFLSHPFMRFPENGNIYSVNQGNILSFPEPYKKYIQYCQEKKKHTGPYSLRYMGSLCADFHRNLIKGGIFMYPPTEKDKNGKLRLLYECNPLAFLAKNAGGVGTNGYTDILKLVPKELHERVPFVVGPTYLVDEFLSFQSSSP